MSYHKNVDLIGSAILIYIYITYSVHMSCVCVCTKRVCKVYRTEGVYCRYIQYRRISVFVQSRRAHLFIVNCLLWNKFFLAPDQRHFRSFYSYALDKMEPKLIIPILDCKNSARSVKILLSGLNTHNNNMKAKNISNWIKIFGNKWN